MSIKKRDVIVVLSFMLLAFILASTRIPQDRVMSNDGCSYATTAKNLVEGKGYTYMGSPNVVFPPVYPIAIASVYIFDKNLERAGYTTSLIFWALTMIPLYLIAMTVLPENFFARALFLLIIVLAPQLNYIAGKVLSEATYIFFLYIAISFVSYFIVKRKEARVLYYCIAGALFSLAYLTRPEGLLFMAVTSVFILLHPIANIKMRIRNAALLIAAFMIVSTPYLIFLKIHTGHLQLSGRLGITLIGGEKLTDKAHVLKYEKELYSVTPDGKQVYMYAGKPISVIGYLMENPGAMFKRFCINFWSYLKELLGILFPLGLFMLLALFPFRKSLLLQGKDFLYLILMMTPLLASMLFFLYERYIFPYLPITFLFCILGLVRFESYLKHRLRLSKIIAGVISVLIILLFQYEIASPYLHPPKIRDRSWNEVKELAFWMKDNIPEIEKKILVSRKAYPAFYSGANYSAMPWVENIEQLYKYLDNVEADYLIADTRHFYHTRPHIYYLVEANRKLKRLALVKVIENNKHSAILWKFLR